MKRLDSLRIRVFGGLLIAMGPFVLAQAQSDRHGAEGDDGRTHWGLGLAAGTQRKPYADYDNKTDVVPLLIVENRYVSVFGPVVDAKLPSLGPVSFTLRGRYAFDDGYKASDSPVLAGMDKRKAGFWLGGTATWHAGFADISGDLSGDASSASNGSQFKLTLEHEYEFGPFGLSPRVSAVWLDRKYVDYYYGVKAAEATTTRSAYEGGSTTNAVLGLRANYKFGEHHMLIMDVSATALGSKIKNSPLVDRSSVVSGIVGYAYSF